MPSDRVLIAGLVLVVALAGCTSVPAGSDPGTTGSAGSPEAPTANEPAERRIAFENLTTARQEEFSTALESGEDVAGPEGWGYGDWAYVEYDGGWYDVHVVVV